jgi:hypothetical protein
VRQRNPESTPADLATLAVAAVAHYFEGASLLGSHEKCESVLEALGAMGVDEAACFIDFGLPVDEVLESVKQLAELVPVNG